MSEEHHDDPSHGARHESSDEIHSDHLPHIAPSEDKAVRKSLWRRWMDWSGSFFVISLLVHVLIIGGAGVVVVQVVQGRKEKLKFTAPPPAPPSEAVHVKPKKTTAAAAPAISKRITSTAANASIALPSMEMSAPAGTDVMSSVMSGMGGSGLGASGMGEGGAGALASMPLSGLTAFGFKGTGRSDGLVGRLYDLKQTKDRQPTDIKDDGFWKNPKEVEKLGPNEQSELFQKALSDPTHAQLSPSLINEAKLLNRFLGGSWDEAILQEYYRSKDPLIAYQWSIANQSQKDVLKAFGVETQIKPGHILIHYKGTVTAPKDCTVRFRSLTREGSLAIRFNGQNVFLNTYKVLIDQTPFKFVNTDPNYDKNYVQGLCGSGSTGKWFNIQAGRKYPIEIVMTMGTSAASGSFGCSLMIEEKNPNPPYQLSSWQWQSKQGRQYQTGEAQKNPLVLLKYPLFALRKGIPSVPFTEPNASLPSGKEWDKKRLDFYKFEGPHIMNPDVAREPMVFPGGGTP